MTPHMWDGNSWIYKNVRLYYTEHFPPWWLGKPNGTFINAMHTILTFRHLPFIKSILSYKHTYTFKLHLIHTHPLARIVSTSKRPAPIGKCPLTKLNLPPPPSPASQFLSPSFPCRAAGVTGWQEYLGWLITRQPGSLDPRDSTCTNHN